MPEKTKQEIHKEKVKEFKKQVNKKDKITTREIIEQIATREILERDYKEDTLEIVFNSSPSTRRKVISHRPTPKQMSEIIARASISWYTINHKLQYPTLHNTYFHLIFHQGVSYE